jgi:hypothetical protein
VNDIDARDRPRYTSLQSIPACSASPIIGSSGVIRIPPAMRRQRGAGANRKWFLGPRERSRSPAEIRSWR